VFLPYLYVNLHGFAVDEMILISRDAVELPCLCRMSTAYLYNTIGATKASILLNDKRGNCMAAISEI
jgi:hypothetical protein